MFHKFKISTCAFILCLFGSTLATGTPVKAEDEEYVKCVNTGKKKGAKYPYKNRMNCFRDLIDDMILQSDVMTPGNANMILDYGNVDNSCTHIGKTRGAKFPYKKRTNCYEQLADDLEHGYTCHQGQRTYNGYEIHTYRRVIKHGSIIGRENGKNEIFTVQMDNTRIRHRLTKDFEHTCMDLVRLARDEWKD